MVVCNLQPTGNYARKMRNVKFIKYEKEMKTLLKFDVELKEKYEDKTKHLTKHF
jgi:hypothetical protein